MNLCVGSSTVGNCCFAVGIISVGVCSAWLQGQITPDRTCAQRLCVFRHISTFLCEGKEGVPPTHTLHPARTTRGHVADGALYIIIQVYIIVSIIIISIIIVTQTARASGDTPSPRSGSWSAFPGECSVFFHRAAWGRIFPSSCLFISMRSSEKKQACWDPREASRITASWEIRRPSRCIHLVRSIQYPPRVTRILG